MTGRTANSTNSPTGIGWRNSWVPVTLDRYTDRSSHCQRRFVRRICLYRAAHQVSPLAWRARSGAGWVRFPQDHTPRRHAGPGANCRCDRTLRRSARPQRRRGRAGNQVRRIPSGRRKVGVDRQAETTAVRVHHADGKIEPFRENDEIARAGIVASFRARVGEFLPKK